MTSLRVQTEVSASPTFFGRVFGFGGKIQIIAPESVKEQYNRDLAEWEYQVSRKPTATAKELHRLPETQGVLKHLREIQERSKQKPPL